MDELEPANHSHWVQNWPTGKVLLYIRMKQDQTTIAAAWLECATIPICQILLVRIATHSDLWRIVLMVKNAIFWLAYKNISVNSLPSNYYSSYKREFSSQMKDVDPIDKKMVHIYLVKNCVMACFWYFYKKIMYLKNAKQKLRKFIEIFAHLCAYAHL